MNHTDMGVLALRISRLSGVGETPHYPPSVVFEALRASSSPIIRMWGLMGDESIYRALSDPEDSLALELTEQLLAHHRQTSRSRHVVSKELQRVLTAWSQDVKDVELLRALDTVMPFAVRQILGETANDLFAILVDGDSHYQESELRKEGTVGHLTIVVQVPPIVEAYLELVFAAVG